MVKEEATVTEGEEVEADQAVAEVAVQHMITILRILWTQMNAKMTSQWMMLI